MRGASFFLHINGNWFNNRTANLSQLFVIYSTIPNLPLTKPLTAKAEYKGHKMED